MPALTIEQFWEEAERSRRYVEKYVTKRFALSPADAEDLASAAIVKAASYEQKENSPGFKGGAKFETYLVTVASNLYKSRLRKPESNTKLYSLDWDKNPAHQITILPKQHELVVASVTSEKIRAAVKNLSSTQKIALEPMMADTPKRTKDTPKKSSAVRAAQHHAMSNLRKNHPELRDLLPGSIYAKKPMHVQANLSP